MTPKKSKNVDKIIKDSLDELLSHLKVEGTITLDKDNEDNYKVKIDTADSGLLIGYHGEVINSLQLLLGIIIYRKLGQWVRIIIDISDYREKREETIKKMAADLAEEAVTKGEPVSLPHLSPLERRIVHLSLADNPNVTSVSEGEGKDRHIVIKPK